MPHTPLDAWSALAARRWGATPSRVTRAYERLFHGINLQGKAVLDIGGGSGLASGYALACGAERATLLEPEASGSGKRPMLDQAREMSDALSLAQRLTISGTTLQDYDGRDAPFDIAFMQASINHLDEQAVVSLHECEVARQRYVEVLGKLASLLRPGAQIVVTDCARRNFFGDFGVRNPFAPTIEWHKHQQPRTWIELFSVCGFHNPEVRWGMHTTLGSLGRRFLDNPVVFYFLSSYFILTMRY